jgi:hypothetical protein
MTDDQPGFDTDLDRRLQSAIVAMSRPASPTGVVESIHQRVGRRTRVMRFSIGAAVVVILVGGAIAAVTLTSSNARPVSHSATKATSSTSSSPLRKVPSGAQSSPPPAPRPCPANQVEPSMATGSFCGPLPPRGNGLGADGVCTGQETTPPCGPGVVPNRYYAYTLPGKCDGLFIFDGRRWVAELTPSPDANTYVWMQLSAADAVRWIGPTGSVGFRPYSGLPVAPCSG